MIRIGTSGWSYKHWAGSYYPDGLKQSEYLSYYSRDFNAAEINTSFYRLPKKETIAGWSKQVDDDFVFCPKMSRYLSHMKKLHDATEPVDRFCNLFEDIKSRLGPVLIQLPENVRYHQELTEEFYKILRVKKDFSFALEVRHDSWFCEESIALMKHYDICLVMAHSEKFPYLEAITCKNVYLRFHGPGALYSSSYSDEFLEFYAAKIKKWEREGYCVWVFFNNDVNGYALENAKKLIGMTS
jgi:uncharacterized protein YecE (DUF72 family)